MSKELCWLFNSAVTLLVTLTGASNARGYEKSRFSTNISLYLGTDAR